MVDRVTVPWRGWARPRRAARAGTTRPRARSPTLRRPGPDPSPSRICRLSAGHDRAARRLAAAPHQPGRRGHAGQPLQVRQQRREHGSQPAEAHRHMVPALALTWGDACSTGSSCRRASDLAARRNHRARMSKVITCKHRPSHIPDRQKATGTESARPRPSPLIFHGSVRVPPKPGRTSLSLGLS
jgi:hypothetical protein